MSNEYTTIIIFLVGQLLINISVLAHINTRLTRVETHIIHLMRRQGIVVRKGEVEIED